MVDNKGISYFQIAVFVRPIKPVSVANHFLDADCAESYKINEVNLMAVTFYLSSNVSLFSLKKVNMLDNDTREALSADTPRLKDIDALFKEKISIKKYFIHGLCVFLVKQKETSVVLMETL